MSIHLDAVDRIAPTYRPGERPVMFQSWRRLLFLHWEVDPSILRGIVPHGLELDLFHGKAYVGLIPFSMIHVRPAWSPPIRILSDFHETNVRIYVHRDGRDPGVWFLSLEAANPIAVAIARAWFKLPYYYASMKMIPGAYASEAEASSETHYRSRRIGAGKPAPGCEVLYVPIGAIERPLPGTLDYFLIERYLLYSGSPGKLYRGQVHHRPYPVQSAKVGLCDETLIAAAGIARPPGPPPLVHYSSGVDVEVFPLRRI